MAEPAGERPLRTDLLALVMVRLLQEADPSGMFEITHDEEKRDVRVSCDIFDVSLVAILDEIIHELDTERDAYH